MVLNFVKDNIALENCLAFMTQKIKFRFIFHENIVSIAIIENIGSKNKKKIYKIDMEIYTKGK